MNFQRAKQIIDKGVGRTTMSTAEYKIKKESERGHDRREKQKKEHNRDVGRFLKFRKGENVPKAQSAFLILCKMHYEDHCSVINSEMTSNSLKHKTDKLLIGGIDQRQMQNR